MIVHGHIFNIFMHFWGTFEKAKFRIRGAYVASVLQSSERASFTSWVRIQLGTTGHVKRVSQRSAESGGFPPGTPVSSHREC